MYKQSKIPNSVKPYNTERLYKLWKEEYFELLDHVLQRKTFDGEYTVKTQDEIKRRTGRKYCWLTPSGTSALMVATLSGSIGPGDEVIVPNYGYVASVNQMKAAGATLKFVEVDDYGHIDVDRIEEQITDKSKALVVVGLYGDAPNMQRIEQIAKDNNLYVINDAAQCAMSKYKDRVVDSYGDTSIMSFGANKHMSTFATYGAIVTDNDELAYRIERVRLNGKTGRDKTVEFVGMNAQSHEDKAVQCWLALKYFDQWQTRRHEIADYYDSRFTEAGVNYRKVAPNCSSVRQKYPVYFNSKYNAHDKMLEEGVETQTHYIDNFATGIFNDQKNINQRYPKTEFHNQCSLSIPMQAFLTDTEVERVADAVIKHKGE
jgi:dTDP-4-amino-4,6-dideoxygalactose transaminase|tara:strand:+ start:836 stop:1957 length:1122 start_codon:yes stop_codon:yes gene_type:complete